jgi:hypothetical protein
MEEIAAAAGKGRRGGNVRLQMSEEAVVATILGMMELAENKTGKSSE